MKYRYIAIEGNIGAGKTSLAQRLADDLKADFIPERFADNVFLEKFYAEPSRHAFQLEMSFLIDRYQQLKDHVFEPDKQVISDYYFGKCLVFAENNLTKDEFSIFKELFENLRNQIAEPDIIIYLRSDIGQLQKNIKK